MYHTTVAMPRIILQLLHFKDDDTNDVKTFVHRLLDRVTSIQVSDDGSVEPWKDPAESILRYIKPRDQWLAVSSLLLKSRLYNKENSNPFKLVDLPRTKHKQPYLPNHKSGFSVSHQWPFAGLAFHETTRTIGLDIVAFDAPNKTLYKSTLEFVQVFHDQFAPSEWTRIESSRIQGDDALLREFYLQWAVKEAYTKALGLGMHVEFSSFSTHFHSVGGSGLWQWVQDNLSEAEKSLSLLGTIVHQHDGESFNVNDPVNWRFVFVPLFANDSQDDCVGCGCICVNRIEEQDNIELQWITVNTLVEQEHDQIT